MNKDGFISLSEKGLKRKNSRDKEVFPLFPRLKIVYIRKSDNIINCKISIFPSLRELEEWEKNKSVIKKKKAAFSLYYVYIFIPTTMHATFSFLYYLIIGAI